MLYHLPGLLEVYVTIGCECSDDYTVGTELDCGADVCKNLLDFLCGIDKVTCTRSAENNQCIGKRCPFSAAGK